MVFGRYAENTARGMPEIELRAGAHGDVRLERLLEIVRCGRGQFP